MTERTSGIEALGGATTTVPQCINCIWKNEPHADTCQAFPNGIPYAIQLNRFDHRKPWPADGDSGITYAPVDPTIPHPLAERDFDP